MRHSFNQGTIHLLDAMGNHIKLFSDLGNGWETASLPFGYYQVLYVNGFQSVNLTSILLTENKELLLEYEPQATYTLIVKATSGQNVSLRLEDGSILEGVHESGEIRFKAPAGQHEILLDNKAYMLQVFKDMVFNPSLERLNLRELSLKVHSQVGTPLSGYSVTIYEGNEVYSTLYSPGNNAELLLPDGDWTLEVYKPPYSMKVNVSIPEEKDVNVKLPTLLEPSRIPLSMYESLGVSDMLEESETTLNFLLGISVSVLFASSLTIFILSLIAALSVQRGVYVSARENIEIMTMLGAGMAEKFMILGFPLLITSLGISLVSGWVSVQLSPIVLKGLTIMGYGLSIDHLYTLLYSAAIGICSWLVSFLRLRDK
jgi:hypothetical protein